MRIKNRKTLKVVQCTLYDEDANMVHEEKEGYKQKGGQKPFWLVDAWYIFYKHPWELQSTISHDTFEIVEHYSNHSLRINSGRGW